MCHVHNTQPETRTYLAGRVPNLGLDFAVWCVQHLRVEFNAHGGADIVVQGAVGIGQAGD